METSEVWKIVAAHPMYEVSDLGRVRSWKNSHGNRRSEPRIMAQSPNQTGYMRVRLDDRDWTVHRLVLASFSGHEPEGLFCCHNNGNKVDNRLENLRWDTPQGNSDDKYRHGTVPYGERAWGGLCDGDAIVVSMLWSITGPDRPTSVEIGRSFGISAHAAANIGSGRRWDLLGARTTRYKCTRRLTDAERADALVGDVREAAERLGINTFHVWRLRRKASATPVKKEKITKEQRREIAASSEDALVLAARYGIARCSVYWIRKEAARWT